MEAKTFKHNVIPTREFRIPSFYLELYFKIKCLAATQSISRLLLHNKGTIKVSNCNGNITYMLGISSYIALGIVVVAVLFVYLCHAAISAVGGTSGSTPAQIKEQIKQISLPPSVILSSSLLAE